jgi:hypothetical protein
VEILLAFHAISSFTDWAFKFRIPRSIETNRRSLEDIRAICCWTTTKDSSNTLLALSVIGIKILLYVFLIDWFLTLWIRTIEKWNVRRLLLLNQIIANTFLME